MESLELQTEKKMGKMEREREETTKNEANRQNASLICKSAHSIRFDRHGPVHYRYLLLSPLEHAGSLHRNFLIQRTTCLIILMVPGISCYSG